MNNPKDKIKKTIPFVMALKIIKCLGINPTKEAQLALQKLEHGAENGKTSRAHDFKHFIFVKVNNTHQRGRQIHCKFIKTPMPYFRNGKLTLDFIYTCQEP